MDPLFWRAEAMFDWHRYCQDHGGVRGIRSKPGEYLLVCPDCGKPKLAVNAEKRAWQCFVCSEGGREGASLVAKIEQLPFGQSLIRVLEGCRQSIGRVDRIETELVEAEAPIRRTFRPVPYPESFRFLGRCEPAATPREMLRPALYCQERGIPAYTAEQMRLGFCTSGPFRNRLIFPCFDSGDRLMFYQGRATWAEKPGGRYIKTLSPKSEDDAAGPSDCLLNLAYVAEWIERFNHRVLLVEGPVDCAHAWPDVVASWGKKISALQMELLVRARVRELDLCWDADALAEMLKVTPVLVDLFRVRCVNLPPGRDPGDMTKTEIEQYRAHAVEAGSGDRFNFLP
jgi:DNA primase